MNINNKLLKRVLCLFFICVIFISNITTAVFAVTDEDKFYTNDDDAIEDLFNMTVADVYGDIKDPLGWLSGGKTFVVIREYLDNDDNTRYKIYVNTPNLPQYLQNIALKTIADGWENKTYEPQSNLIANIGEDNNVMTKFGFNISVNKYQGEYPRLYMSLSGILPVKWYQKIWRGLKALVGLSFVDAPDKENYRTLNYYNHMYSEVNNDLIDFIQDYWLDYFVDAILSDENNYFRDAEDLKAQLITKDEYEDAKNFKDTYKSELKDAHDALDRYNTWYDKYYNYEGVYNNVPAFKSAIDSLQQKVDNETDSTKKAQYEAQLSAKKSTWEDYVEDLPEKEPEITEEQQQWLTKEAQAQIVIVRYENFKDRWEYGKSKNEKSYKSDSYSFSYAQCLLDMTNEEKDENDCTKMVDGQEMSGSVVDVFVESGVYRIGLTDDSKQASLVADSGGETFEKQSSYKKLGEITSSTGSKKAFTKPSGTGTNTAQSFAYVNGGYAISYVDEDGPPSYVVLYDSNGNYKGKVKENSIDHANGACSTPDGNYLVSGLLNGNSTTGYMFNIDGNSVKYKKKVNLPTNTSAIAYDKDTGKYILSAGHTMHVYDQTFKTSYKSVKRNIHGTYYQDIGAGGGYIFACHTKTKGGQNNGMNYIDIYNEDTGDYCGTYEVPYGELESVDVVNGELVVLVHIKGSSTNYIQHTGVRVGSGNGHGGSSTPLEYKEDGLSRVDAIKIITLLQSKCGPTYKEVMENIVACMINNAAHEGEEIELEEYIDVRVMPYDRDTLIPSGGGGVEINGETIHITDPRVTIYEKENIIGSYVTTGHLHLEYLLENNMFTKGAIFLTAILSKFSIFFNQVTNFQVLDDLGLSPTNMWKSFSATMVTIIIMMLLIINIVICAFKFIKGNAGLKQLIGKVVFFLGILTLIFLLVLYPDKTWSNYKTLFNKVNNIGEMTIISTLDNVEELYGDGQDSSVTYYLTYFNLWTLYNTGYSIADPQQVIDYNDPEAEDMMVPKINDTETNLWCVVLADSFNRNGENVNNLSLTGKNGLSVNPNAYRVVDHFLAPRLYTTGPTADGGGEGSLNMVNTVNENFNGKFQKLDIFTGLGCVINGANVCVLAFIKMITFLWMWYMLYIFVFNIVLGAMQPRNGMRDIVIRTLSPILAMAVIGAYVGLVIEISMLSTGIINCVLNIVLLILTFRFLAGWQNRFALSFPAPLKYLVILTDRNSRNRYKMRKEIDQDKFDSRFDGDIDVNTIIDDHGNYKGPKDDEKAKRAYERAIKEAQEKAQTRNNYEDIDNEALREKIIQLDRTQNIPVGMAGTAIFNMEDELRDNSRTYTVNNKSSNNTNGTNNPNSSINTKGDSKGLPTSTDNKSNVNNTTKNSSKDRFKGKKIDEGGKISETKK